MIKTVKHLFLMRFLMILLAAIIAGGFTGCTSKKKLARQKAASERTAAIEKAKTDLLAIINDNGKMSIAAKEAKVTEIKAKNLQDPEVDELIIRAEAAIEKQKQELKRLEEEKEKNRKAQEEKEAVAEQKYEKIDDYLESVVNSKSLDLANSRINETLKFFASPEVPVLIIIYQESDFKDYDKPTTIKKYLEYLKDQKKNPNKVNDVKYNDNGKITELELLKK